MDEFRPSHLKRPLQHEIVRGEFYAVAGVAATVLAHDLNAVTFFPFVFDDIVVEKLVKILPDRGGGVCEVVGHRALLQPRFHLLDVPVLAADVLVNEHQLLLVIPHLKLREAARNRVVLRSSHNLAKEKDIQRFRQVSPSKGHLFEFLVGKFNKNAVSFHYNRTRILLFL